MISGMNDVNSLGLAESSSLSHESKVKGHSGTSSITSLIRESAVDFLASLTVILPKCTSMFTYLI